MDWRDVVIDNLEKRDKDQFLVLKNAFSIFDQMAQTLRDYETRCQELICQNRLLKFELTQQSNTGFFFFVFFFFFPFFFWF